MQLTQGVHALSLTYDLPERSTTIHPAVVETDHGLLLVDAGYGGQVATLEAALDAEGFALDDVSVLLLTHQDGDHAGCAAAVADRTGALVLAHERAAPYVDGRERPLKATGERYPPTPVDLELRDGEALRTEAGRVEVVATPGHAPGHLSLYVPDHDLLLAADALTAPEGVLEGPSERFTLDMPEAARSVARLAERDVERVLCYHGGVVEADASDVAQIAESLST